MRRTKPAFAKQKEKKKTKKKGLCILAKNMKKGKKKRSWATQAGGGRMGWQGKGSKIHQAMRRRPKKKGTERNDEKRKKRKRYIQTFWFVVRADTAPAEVGGKGTSTTAGRKAEEQGTSSRPPLTNRFANPANATGPAVPGRN